MKSTRKSNYLKGKTVFIVSLIVICATFLTVWLTGINYNREITSNLYLSLSIIGAILFIFMTYGLYRGVGLEDNFPKYRGYKTGDLFTYNSSPSMDTPDAGDGIAELIMSIVLWIVMTIAIIILMLLLEAIFWFSLFIIIMMLYWVFFRALKLVFNKTDRTVGDIFSSMYYSLSYTILYLGWIFGIVYLTQII